MTSQKIDSNLHIAEELEGYRSELEQAFLKRIEELEQSKRDRFERLEELTSATLKQVDAEWDQLKNSVLNEAVIQRKEAFSHIQAMLDDFDAEAFLQETLQTALVRMLGEESEEKNP